MGVFGAQIHRANAGMPRRSFSPSLVVGHIINDMSTNSISGLLPVLAAVYGLSYMLAGVLVMVFNITSSILQPLIGRWFDRTQAQWLLETGIAVNCVGMGLLSIAPNYATLLILLAAAGLGSAAFHPPAFSTVVKSSTAAKGGALGIFLSGGNTGFFLGPLVAGLLVSAFGLQGIFLLLPIGLTAAALLHRIPRERRQGTPTTTEEARPANKRLLTLLATITAVRSIAIQSAVTFLPLYFVARGDSLLLATSIASFWLAVGVLGQLAGGTVSDRIGRRPIIVSSLLAGALFFYAFLITTGLLSLLFLALSGALLYASWSVIVAMSSEAAPSNVGAVTGFMLGFSIGIGGLGAIGFGGTADAFGLNAAFNLVTALAVAAGLIALLLPRRV